MPTEHIPSWPVIDIRLRATDDSLDAFRMTYEKWRMFNKDVTSETNSPVNKLRLDARLLQILAGVRRGDIAVEDAALEIIEGRDLDRRSFLADTSTEFFGDRQDLMTAEMLKDICKSFDISPTLLDMPVVVTPAAPPDVPVFKPRQLLSWGADVTNDLSVFSTIKKAKA